MVATLKKAFDYSCNRVYKKINTRQKQNVVEPTKTPDNPFYTVVPLNSKLKFIDKRNGKDKIKEYIFKNCKRIRISKDKTQITIS